MNISVFGLGYVGVVTSAILSKNNTVIGVDVNPVKIDMINQGNSPIIEKEIDTFIQQGIQLGNLFATTDAEEAVLHTDISVICVGTPSNEDGSHNLTYLHRVLENIAEILREKKEYHLIVIRSTVPPGTCEHLKDKYFKNIDIGICFNPEFLREGVAVADYIDPPFIVIGCNDTKSEKLMKEFYRDIKSEFYTVSFKEAEVLKMLCNVYHALKISFANEVGRFSSAYGISGKSVMELLCRDKKLNISSKYMMPGYAYGGSCLPKDLRSFLYLAKQKNIKLPVTENIELSNDKHIEDSIKKIERLKTKNIGIIGLSFKDGTDDLRESPYVRLVEYFIGKGYNIKIYDNNVSLAKLIGANKAYIEQEIPHISTLLVNNLDEMNDREIIVLNRTVEKLFKSKHKIDLR